MQQVGVSAQASNEVKKARLEFAATVNTFDTALNSYSSNAVSEAAVQAALDAVQNSQSNLVWLALYWRTNK